jgi:hypothetical protein
MHDSELADSSNGAMHCQHVQQWPHCGHVVVVNGTILFSVVVGNCGRVGNSQITWWCGTSMGMASIRYSLLDGHVRMQLKTMHSADCHIL